jgi:hypothetical protein
LRTALRLIPLPVTALLLSACPPGAPPELAPPPVPDTVTVVDTVTMQTGIDPNPELEQRIARLQLQLLEKDVLVDELQLKLDAAIQEVVRAMAKLQSQASRAEAASAMAEAEIALDALRTAGGETASESAQAAQLLEMATTEFNNQHYGGSLYLAGQARGLARTGAGRFGGETRGSLQPGEALFALPLPLRTVRRSNVREGPGLESVIVFTLDPEVPVVGYSYTNEWVRISDDQGRSGWIFHSLVGNR